MQTKHRLTVKRPLFYDFPNLLWKTWIKTINAQCEIVLLIGILTFLSLARLSAKLILDRQVYLQNQCIALCTVGSHWNQWPFFDICSDICFIVYLIGSPGSARSPFSTSVVAKYNHGLDQSFENCEGDFLCWSLHHFCSLPWSACPQPISGIQGEF